jgi:hypothetical protein
VRVPPLASHAAREGLAMSGAVWLRVPPAEPERY